MPRWLFLLLLSLLFLIWNIIQLLYLGWLEKLQCKDFATMQYLTSIFLFVAILDGKEIRELTRQFLVNWKASKEARKNKKKPLMSGGLSARAMMSESVCLSVYYRPLFIFSWSSLGICPRFEFPPSFQVPSCLFTFPVTCIHYLCVFSQSDIMEN